jgi:DNA-binding MarR family transcriptional regulator
MEKRGLVMRSRDHRDRRVVLARISESGLRLLERVDDVVDAMLMSALSPLGPKKLATLNDLLEAARAPRDK